MTSPPDRSEVRVAARGFPSLAIRALHIFGLSAFAFAQPLFGLFADQPAFFVAHRAAPLDILAFVAILCLVIPGGLVLFSWLLALVSPWAARAWHVAVVWGLAAIVLLPLPGRAGLDEAWGVGVAMLLAAMGTAAYGRAPAVRSFTTLLAAASLAFPVMFLARAEIVAFWLPKRGDGVQLSGTKARAVPIVMVVFDELSLSPLLDEDDRIDAARYPAFGRLAATSHWYRNATTVADNTIAAVPALLTGRFPTERDRLPTAASYPGNLFTLLGSTHALNVVETVTELCPPALCPRVEEPFGRRLASLMSDAGIVFLHWSLPERLRSGLPSISEGWAGFGRQDAAHGAGTPDTDALLVHIGQMLRENREDTFQQFVDSIPVGPAPAVHFLHVLLPHVPHEYLPSGRLFSSAGFRSERSRGEQLIDEPAVVESAYRRYLLQLQYVDRLLGTLWDRLDRLGLFEPALIVVTSDHGVSYRPGGDRRDLNEANGQDVLAVPLFVKLPGQDAASVTDRNAELIDVLPTIAEVLAIELPWPTAGSSLLAEGRPERATKRALRGSDGAIFELPAHDFRMPAGASHVARFGRGQDLRPLFATAGHAELIGTPVGHWPSLPANGSVDLDDPARFTELRLSSRMRPVNVTGRLRDLGPDAAHIAVAVNGIVAGIGGAYRDGHGRAAFEALVSDEYFVEGSNAIEVFAVSGHRTGGYRLARIPGSFDAGRARLEGDRLTAPDAAILLEGSALRGFIEQVSVEDRDVVLIGWAFAEDRRRPADQVLLFSGGAPVASASVAREREDVSGHFEMPEILDSGFLLRVPIERWQRAVQEPVSIIALAGDVGARVPWSPRYTECQVRRIGVPRRPAASPAAIPMAREAAPSQPTDLRLPRGGTARMTAGSAKGYVESVRKADGCATVAGWALDARHPDRPVTILAVQGRTVVREMRTHLPRPDVALALGLERASAGFEFELIAADLERSSIEVRVYAVTADGVAVELEYPWPTRAAKPPVE